MKLCKDLVLIGFTSFVIVPSSFVFGSNRFYNVDVVNALFGPQDDCSTAPQDTLSFDANGHYDIEEVQYENDAYLYGGVAPLNANFIAPDMAVDGFYDDRSGVKWPPHPSPHWPIQDLSTSHYHLNTLTPLNRHIKPSNRQTSPYPFYSGQSLNNRSFRDNDKRHSTSCPTLNDGTPSKASLEAARTPVKLPPLIKISDLNRDRKWRETLKKEGFRPPKAGSIVHFRPICMKGSESENVAIYATCLKTSDRKVYARTENSRVHVRASGSVVSLYKMKANAAPPRRLKTRFMLELKGAQTAFVNAEWSFHISPSGNVVKTGCDHSQIILRLVTKTEVKQIELGNQDKIINLFPEEGDLLLAYSAELEQIVPKIKNGTTYETFVKNPESFTNLKFDQLIIAFAFQATVQNLARPLNNGHDSATYANSSKITPPNVPLEAVEASYRPLPLVKISVLTCDPKWKEDFKNSGFLLAKGKSEVNSRSICMKGFQSKNVTVYATYLKSSQNIYGRIGISKVHIHVSPSLLSLYKMEANAGRSVGGHRNQGAPIVRKVSNARKYARWYIGISPSGKITKTGIDHSEITLRLVSKTKVSLINLGNQNEIMELSPEKGDFLLIYSTELEQIIPRIEEGTTCKQFLGNIKEFIDHKLDQLIAVFEF